MQTRREFLTKLSFGALLSIAQTRAPLTWDDDQIASMEGTETEHRIDAGDNYGYGPGLAITLGVMRGTITKVGPGRSLTIRWNRIETRKQP